MKLLTSEEVINPYDADGNLTSTGKRLFEKGAEILRSSIKLGVVILSGGEGTRLGIDYPKGLFVIENNTLFHWHVMRIDEIYRKYKTQVYLYIMTSEKTHDKVAEFFSKKKYDCVKNVILFKEDDIETLDLLTKQPLKLEDKVVRSALGNGEVYKALKKAEYVDEMAAFNVISVDNVLANVIDEVYIGAFYEYKLDVLSKAVIAKENEKVGAFFNDGGKIIVREYSELNGDSKMSSLGNICNHLFSSKFVKRMGDVDLPMHEAMKKVKFTNSNNEVVIPSYPNGIKRERFIFDAFNYTTKNNVMCVIRDQEFSPLKNNLESLTDNYNSCLSAVKKSRIPKMI